MEILTYGIVGYAIIAIGGWAIALAAGLLGNMIRAFLFHHRIRRDDFYQVAIIVAILSGLSIIIFIYPHAIQSAPGATLVFVIGSVTPLLYLTEKYWKDWDGLCKTIKSQTLTSD